MKKLSKTYDYLKAYLPAIIWAIFIFSLSAQSTLPSAPISWLDVFLKQTAHSIVYAILYYLLLHSNENMYQEKINPHRKIILAGIAFFYAITDEIHQYFVPNRQASLVDIGFDLIGISLIYFIKH